MERSKEEWVRVVEFQDELLAHGEAVLELLGMPCNFCQGWARIMIAMADWDTATFKRVHRKFVQANRG